MKRSDLDEFVDCYRSTDGQMCWSDTHQLAGEFTGHRAAVDPSQGTEMITEVYLRHDQLLPFFAKVREDLLRREADLTYGTIRFIEPDHDTFLPWAKEKSVCVVCNLHMARSEEGIAKARGDFQQIIDRVIEFDGRFFLTYYRWGTPEQVATCYPQIGRFCELKRKYDPEGLLQSEWYRHYAPAFA